VATDSYLSVAERASLTAQQIDSMLIVPMVVNANLVGLLAFMNRIATAASATSMRALRHMADLAAVVVENRSLLQITGQSLEETQLLYEINRAILGAQDTLDVLRVIRELLTPDALAITELSVSYDDLYEIQDLTVNFMNMGGNEQSVEMPLRDQIGIEALQRLQDYWNSNRSTVTIVEDLETSDRDYPISDFIRMSGARSFVNVIVRQGSRVQQMINMSFADARTFSSAERRLYTSLSTQIGIVMQNHRLLREAQCNAGEMSRRVGQLQGINQVSSRILRASNEAAMVTETSEALVNLLGIDHCGITLIDPNDPDFLIVAGEYPVSSQRSHFSNSLSPSI
jgi:GAF domain-containing protein